MAQRSRFFDDSTGDRVYTSDDWSLIVLALMSTGVVPTRGDELAVTESSPAAMSVRVGLGIAFVDGYYFEVYTAAETLAIAAADATNPRIDRVVVRRSLANRTVSLAVLTGAPAAAPVAPALTQDPAGTFEISLAQVLVGANVNSILNANITDERGARSKGPDIAALVDPATGHDHDGTDSKAIGGVAGPDAPINPDGAGAVGTAGTLARAQHGHRLDTTGSAGAAITIDDPASGGAQGDLARAGHGHRLDTYGLAPAAVQAIADAGTASIAPSRGDHKHPREAGYGLTPPAVAATGVDGTPGEAPSRGDHRHAHGSGYLPDAHHLKFEMGSAGGGAAGNKVWVGTTDPGAAAAEGDIWVKA